MRKSIFLLTVVFILPLLIIPAICLSGEKSPISSHDNCSRLKNSFVAAEKEWASVNAEVGFMREELERLRSLRWEIKIIVFVLDDAREIIKKRGSLSNAQRMTLNSRIPDNRGTINPDNTFTMTVLGRAPLGIKEAGNRLADLLSRAESDIKKTEKDLESKEKRSHLLSRKAAGLEDRVEKECSAAGNRTPWQEGVPRVTSEELYRRYAERERLRQQEVDARRNADMERRYYYQPYSSYPHMPGYHYRPYSTYPYYSVYRSGALLVRLTGVDVSRSCLRCYGFSSSWEKGWILDELDKAARDREQMPCVGNLGGFRVIEVLDDISQCYQRLH